MTKSMRLRRRREFLAVQGTGTKINARHFLALATRREAVDASDPCAAGAGRGRVGMTVTRRVGNAVVRNRIRRFAREWLRRNGWVPTGWDVVIIAKESAAALAGYGEVAADLSRIQRHLAC